MQSEWLAYRQPIYIAGGFAGILALSLMLFQPLLADGVLPGLAGLATRRLHRAVGVTLLALVALHVAGLWITSPPDMIDALTFTAPTWFSVWGVVAMWALVATAVVALLRKRIGLRSFRRAHTGLAVVIVVGSLSHALLIEGAMGWGSKLTICAAVALALAVVFWRRWIARH